MGVSGKPIGRRTALAGIASLVATCAAKGDTPRVSLKNFGAVGDGVADDSRAWRRFIEAAVTFGGGYIPPGHYRIPDIKRATPRHRGLSLHGAGSGSVLLDATGASRAVLFSLRDASLEVHGIATRNLSLIEAHETLKAPIGHINVTDWTWTNDAPESPRALSVYNPYDQHPFPIEQIRLQRIRGSGGACGVWIRSAIRQCEIDDVEIRNIRVPDSADWYFRSRPDKMVGIGTATGLYIGEDRAPAQALFESCQIGRLVVDGVVDERQLKGEEKTAANCDGVRLLAQNVYFQDITVRRVTSHARSDCTGVYTKVVNLTGDALTIENAGHHEASLTLKGAGPEQNDSGARGGAVRLRSVRISNDEGFVGRPAAYFRCADVTVQSLEVVGCGGDVEDPYNPGNRIHGASSVVRMSPPSQGRFPFGELQIGRLVMRDCTLGGVSERWAVSLGAYDRIRLNEVVCEGLSNEGRFTDQRFWDAQNINVLAFAEKEVPLELLEIGSVYVRGCRAPGKRVHVLRLLGTAPIRKIRLGPIDHDKTVGAPVRISGSIPIDDFEWRPGCGTSRAWIQTPPKKYTVIEPQNGACTG